MGIFISILLLLIAVSLFVAAKKKWIKSSSIQLAASIAGIVSLLAALAVFILPSDHQSITLYSPSSVINDTSSTDGDPYHKTQSNSSINKRNNTIIFLDNSSSDSIAFNLYNRLKNSIIYEYTFHYYGYKSKTIYEEKDKNLIHYEDQNDTITINTNFRDYKFQKGGNLGKPFSQLNESQVQSYKHEIIRTLKSCIENKLSQIDSVDKHSFLITLNEYKFEVVRKDSTSSFLTYLDFHEKGKQRLFLSGFYPSTLSKSKPTYFPLEGTSGLYSLTQQKFRLRNSK